SQDYIEILKGFTEELTSKANDVPTIFYEGDLIKLQQLAHSLKGSSGSICAKDLFEACEKLDFACRNLMKTETGDSDGNDKPLLNPDISTLNSDVSTPNPDGSTLNTDVSIPNPDGSTLNTDVSIPNPDLSTLNPALLSLEPLIRDVEIKIKVLVNAINNTDIPPEESEDEKNMMDIVDSIENKDEIIDVSYTEPADEDQQNRLSTIVNKAENKDENKAQNKFDSRDENRAENREIEQFDLKSIENKDALQTLFINLANYLDAYNPVKAHEVLESLSQMLISPVITEMIARVAIYDFDDAKELLNELADKIGLKL
ncbi:MAG: Hpt domain-containing protein, partial [Desulfamplus sp.]|nr:Hpt domain-containing protein [Desulfamplus sp.]